MEKIFLNRNVRLLIIVIFLLSYFSNVLGFSDPKGKSFLIEMYPNYPEAIMSLFYSFQAFIAGSLIAFLLFFPKLSNRQKLPFIYVLLSYCFNFHFFAMYDQTDSIILLEKAFYWTKVFLMSLSLCVFIVVEYLLPVDNKVRE